MDVAELTEDQLEAAMGDYDRLSRAELNRDYGVPKKGQAFVIHGRRHYELGALGRIAQRRVSGQEPAPSERSSLERRLAELVKSTGHEVVTTSEKPDAIFGHVPGFEVGHVFRGRYDAYMFSVHRALQEGIAGSGDTGAESIVISGGYEDDQDDGWQVIYTGHGGREEGGRQTEDQSFEARGNAALRASKHMRKPVRVIRLLDDRRRTYSYDGLYLVEDYWREPGKRGKQVCRFRLALLEGAPSNLTDQAPPNEAPAGAQHPERRQRTGTQVERLAEVRDCVLKHYDYTCQACGTRLMFHDVPFAEGAHIRPVGRPHNGPDQIDNILCLCPNCHRQFDNGALIVEEDHTLIRNGQREGTLTVDETWWTPSAEHLAYHRKIRS